MHLHTNGECKASGSEPFTRPAATCRSMAPDIPRAATWCRSMSRRTAPVKTTTTDKTWDQIDGKSIIIHADADNFGNIPTRYAAKPR